jgi:hypothetical protein
VEAHPDWLFELLTACEARFDPRAASARFLDFQRARPELGPTEGLRRYVEHRLRETGLVFGAPLVEPARLSPGAAGARAVLEATLQVQAELALEVGLAVGQRARGLVRVLELGVCLALLARRAWLAGRLHRLCRSVVEQGPASPRALRLLRRLGAWLGRRAYLAGNPRAGLPIQNSLTYVDSKTLGRLAVVYFERGLARPDLRRVLAFHARERRLLLFAVLGLSLAGQAPPASARRLMRAQLRLAGVPFGTRWALGRLLRRPVPAAEVAAEVENPRARDFLVEQLLLAAMLDGQVSPDERGFIARLAGRLGLAELELVEREAELVAFFERHADALGRYTVTDAVRLHRGRMLPGLQAAIAENAGLIAEEVRRTGDLAELLMRAASGERLPPEDWARVRARLLDVVRGIPALAIFSLPGGALLLPLVFRLLPDGLKPRAFAERDRRLREAAGRAGSSSGAQP